jgi:hypothetical protein
LSNPKIMKSCVDDWEPPERAIVRAVTANAGYFTTTPFQNATRPLICSAAERGTG